MNFRCIGRAATISAAFVAMLPAQTQFNLRLSQGNNSFAIQNNATLSFNSPVGQTTSAQITGTYTGTGQVNISLNPTVFGSSEFNATLRGARPQVLSPGNTFTFTIDFTPTSSAQTNGQLFLPFVETVPPNGNNPTQLQGNITLNLLGTSPQFALNYVLPTDQNVVPLPSGGLLTVPATPLGTTSQVALNISNIGSGAGVVTGINISGSAFKLARLPLLPISVPGGQAVQVLILYTPTGQTLDTGQVQVTFDSGPPITANLQGTNSSGLLVYSSLQTDPPSTIPSGGTLTFPGTNVGQSSSAIVRITNTGNSSATISSIAATGAGYTISNLPQLPQVLAPSSGFNVTVNFTPTTPTTATGTLFINSDTIKLSGIGLGSQLVLSYDVAGSTVTLSPTNNSVIFSPVQISKSAQLSFDVKNTGTIPATISNIGIGQANSPFSISNPPPLPTTLAPGEDFRIPVTFTPAALGFSNGTLVIDSNTVNLVGSGTAPPPLPAYTIVGASGTIAPGSQTGVSLALASPYPVPLAGTLALGVSGDLPSDPAVQFASGGSTVSFTIPANTTNAVFGNQGTQIGLQSGTVASTITLTPTFATRAGNVDLTPASPTTLQTSISPAAPSLTSIALTNQSATGFTISVTGFTTTRKLTAWNVQFTPAPGFDMPTSKFTIDVSAIANTWFRSTASNSFGGQFTLAVPFTLGGTPPSGQSLLGSLASVSVTVSNELGTSNAISAKVQ